MSQAQLGKSLGVSRRTVSAWEIWESVPDPARIDKIRETLRLSDLDVWRITNRAAVKASAKKGGPIW